VRKNCAQYLIPFLLRSSVHFDDETYFVSFFGFTLSCLLRCRLLFEVTISIYVTGLLYCVGGSDGQSFLSSVERYNPNDGELWTLTSWTLGVPRNCAGVAAVRRLEQLLTYLIDIIVLRAAAAVFFSNHFWIDQLQQKMIKSYEEISCSHSNIVCMCCNLLFYK